MKRTRIEVRYTEKESQLIKKAAKTLDWKITETLRRSLRFGLNALLKFETNKKMDLKKLEASLDPEDDQEDYNQSEITEEDIEIAKTKWLED